MLDQTCTLRMQNKFWHEDGPLANGALRLSTSKHNGKSSTGLKQRSTYYRTGEEHANHYSIDDDVVCKVFKKIFKQSDVRHLSYFFKTGYHFLFFIFIFLL